MAEARESAVVRLAHRDMVVPRSRRHWSLVIGHWREWGARAGYRDLVVWQLAMDLVVECYELTRAYPITERYGLVSQIRRAAISIPANIAEGRTRRSPKDFVRFIRIAEGSEAELETLIELSVRLDFLSAQDATGLLNSYAKLARMLSRLRERLAN